MAKADLFTSAATTWRAQRLLCRYVGVVQCKSCPDLALLILLQLTYIVLVLAAGRCNDVYLTASILLNRNTLSDTGRIDGEGSGVFPPPPPLPMFI